MQDWLLNTARAFRRLFYQISSMKVFGLELDNFLHFFVGAALFAYASRKWGTRVACWTLGILIVVKEVIDVFAKSRVEYIDVPTSAEVSDTIWDIATAILGGLVAWWWLGRKSDKPSAAE